MVPWKLHLWVWLSITININSLKNISSENEQKTTFAHYQTLYTNSTEGTSYTCKYLEEPAASYTIPTWCRWRQDTTHTTEAQLTRSLPSFRKFWYSLMVGNSLSHFQLFCLMFFCSSSTQTVLTRTRTVGSTEYKDHLQLKHSTVEKHINTTLPCHSHNIDAEHSACRNPQYLAHMLQ